LLQSSLRFQQSLQTLHSLFSCLPFCVVAFAKTPQASYFIR
jgi:hypothetical protein